MSLLPQRLRRLRGLSSARPLALASILATAVLGGAVLGPVAADSSSSGTLESRIAASEAHEGELHAGIGADTHQIAGFQGSIDDLQTRLDALETSLDTERDLLASLRSQLRGARANLASLQVQLGRDRHVLVAQLIASYESPPPDIVTVVLQAHGFADLLERLDDLRAISRENAGATVHVAEEQKAVTVQAAQLATLEATHARETSAVLVQRDEVAQLHLALLSRQLQYIRARDRRAPSSPPWNPAGTRSKESFRSSPRANSPPRASPAPTPARSATTPPRRRANMASSRRPAPTTRWARSQCSSPT